MATTENPEKRPTQPDGANPRSGLFARLMAFDQFFGLVTRLSLLTGLSTVVVGYFQYLNAYQEKVSSQAREDMALASSTFAEVSTAFSEIQALQQILYADFRKAAKNRADTSKQALVNRNALEISDAYEKARTRLRQNIDVLARKVEVNIDWSSNIYRDPTEKHNVNDDPLNLLLLRDYQFNCSDQTNFPKFGNAKAAPREDVPVTPDETFCASDRKQSIDDTTMPKDAVIRICPADKGQAARINWFSARHHVLTMHYCFEKLHDRLDAARQWAAKSDHEAAVRENDIPPGADSIGADMDDLARRLDAFTGLSVFQLERIRVKYRPTGFVCTVPGLNVFYHDRCQPLQTATSPKR